MRRLILLALLAFPTACGAQTAPTLTPMTRPQYLAECGARQKRAGVEAKFIASTCAQEFATATATLPLARAIVRIARTPPAQLQSQAQLKAIMPSIAWTRPVKQAPPITVVFQGSYAKDLAFSAMGAGKVQTIAWNWSEETATLPYDVPGALRLLGAKVTAYACSTGGGAYGDERGTDYRVEVPGAAPLHLSIGGRDAAMGGQWGFWGITIEPGAPVPGYAALVARARAGADGDGESWSPCTE
ncbi:hypothetical protein [Sphingomonas sp.]|uniref:hypothetical protein n=1 Tax=Sphingomonas sp. TaxID=28214 RepID=UPI001B22A21D|nr:hypothetical protein [Sphingomonas sp.]MBO9713277.1 hypothetical protein [Sphingomonas sp.]